MSNKKSEKTKKDVTNLFVGHATGLKITAGHCEFLLKTKKHGTQLFVIDPKEIGYLGIVLAAFTGKHIIGTKKIEKENRWKNFFILFFKDFRDG